jgi:hypothetical protein
MHFDIIHQLAVASVADPDRFFPDPGSRISDPGYQTHIFESLVTIFWAKNFFLQHFKTEIIFNFVKFVAT